MKRNLYLGLISVLVLGLAAGLPFAFTEWNSLLVQNQTVLILYIVSKVVFGLILIFALVWSFVGERARGHIYMAISSSMFVQIAPLLIRTSVYIKNFVLGFAIIMLALFLIGYIAFIGLVLTANKKQVASDKKYQGKEINVVDEKEAEKRNKEDAQ